MGAHQTQRGVNIKLTRYNEKILIRFVVMGAFSLETLEKSCLLYSILRFTEVLDTLIMQYESFCYCLSQCTFHIAIYNFLLCKYMLLQSTLLFFLAKWMCTKRDFYNEGHLRVFQE